MSQSTLQSGFPGGSPLKPRLVGWPLAGLTAAQRWFKALDQILRGETTRPAALRGQALEIPVGGLFVLIVALAVLYGFCMGMYPGCRVEDPSWLLWLSCTLKIPALFLLTLVVTFPSLYVVNALVGSRLRLPAVLQLLVASLGVNLAVLASTGPIVAFFSFSTTNGHFMILLNVLVFAVAGLLGMSFLLQTLHRMSTAAGESLRRRMRELAGLSGAPGETRETGQSLPASESLSRSWEREPWLSDPKGPRPATPPADATTAVGADEPSALDALEGHVLGRHVKKVFCCWAVIFGVVGAQMAWVLRPYFGAPGEPFVWFGRRELNFFEGVLKAFHQLFP